VILVVFDVSSQESFDQLDGFIKDAKNNKNDAAIIAVVANKIDLERTVGEYTAKSFAEEQGNVHAHCSCENGCAKI
jgi:GTPase SAR1 family protein